MVAGYGCAWVGNAAYGLRVRLTGIRDVSLNQIQVTEAVGIEPISRTFGPRRSRRHSIQLSYAPTLTVYSNIDEDNGGGGIRTHNLSLVADAAIQLGYAPMLAV